MRNILLSLFFFIKKDNVILVQDSHSNKEKTLICNIFWIIHRISKKFVQGIIVISQSEHHEVNT